MKTVADSVLGTCLLARPSSRHLLIAGAGAVAASLARSCAAVMPQIGQISIRGRRSGQAQALVASLGHLAIGLDAPDDLSAAVGAADIVSAATMARNGIVRAPQSI